MDGWWTPRQRLDQPDVRHTWRYVFSNYMIIFRSIYFFIFQPERIDPNNMKYDIRADVWSLGITLVELATGSFPYKECSTDFEVLTRVLESEPPSLPTDAGFSLDFQTFVKKW